MRPLLCKAWKPVPNPWRKRGGGSLSSSVASLLTDFDRSIFVGISVCPSYAAAIRSRWMGDAPSNGSHHIADDTMPAQPSLRYALGSTVAPGDRICSARKCGAGDGVYVRGGNIYASSVGKLNLVASGDTYAVTVVLDGGKQRASSQVLSVGQVVLGRVVRVITQQAFVEIVSADVTGPLKEKHSGSIRKEDVRAGATEEVGIYASFRPGDIVLCRVLSLGDSRRYYLTTGEAELGVIRASCSSCRENMAPLNWKEMECPACKHKELRKCAKPRDLRGGGPKAEIVES